MKQLCLLLLNFFVINAFATPKNLPESIINTLNQKLTTTFTEWRNNKKIITGTTFKQPDIHVHASHLGNYSSSNKGISTLRPGSLIAGSINFGGRLPNILIDKKTFKKLSRLGAKYRREVSAELNGHNPTAIEIEIINRAQAKVLTIFKNFDYAGIKNATSLALAERRFMSLGQFINLGWGDCRQHTAALGIIMTGAGIKKPSYSNNLVTITRKKPYKTESWDHTFIRYIDTNGQPRTVDAMFRIYDGLPITTKNLKDKILVHGKNFALIQKPGKKDNFLKYRNINDILHSTKKIIQEVSLIQAELLKFPKIIHINL